MIVQLDNQNVEVATKMQKIFRASYSVEVKILNATDFPPLNRTLEEYRQTSTVFYGLNNGKELAGIVEIRNKIDKTHIQSLVVSPKYFKQGVASQLMKFVIEKYGSALIFVETGVDNIPAIKLYEKFGFKPVKKWDTEIGIRKIRLDK